MTKSCEISSKIENDKNDFDKNDKVLPQPVFDTVCANLVIFLCFVTS